MRLQLVPLIESGDRLQLVANREHQAKTDVLRKHDFAIELQGNCIVNDDLASSKRA